MQNANLVEQIRDIYQQIDQQTADFALATGLQCPVNCGHCCENPEIETTVLEMLPVASELLRLNLANEYFIRLENCQQNTICLLYEPLGNSKGRCFFYESRPALCRLFGFAAIKNKQESVELAGCRIHKQTIPAIINYAQESINKGLEVPLFAETYQVLNDLYPALAEPRMPINIALKKALEWLSYKEWLIYQSND